MNGFFPIFANILSLETKCNKVGWKQDFESYSSLRNKSTWKVQQDLHVALLSGHLSPGLTSCDPSSGVNSSNCSPESSPDPAHVAQTLLHPLLAAPETDGRKNIRYFPNYLFQKFQVSWKWKEHLCTQTHWKFNYKTAFKILFANDRH